MARKWRKNDLAFHGGKPVHARPWRTGTFHFFDEIEVLGKVLAGPALPLARGKWVMAYREALQDLYGMKHAVTTSSGSAALHVALAAAGVGAGDEVIVSPLTDYGSLIGILQLNAIPVFADVQADGMLMDVGSIAERITSHTRAIMPVHNGGYAVDMPAVMRLARKHKITVVEDCAQSHLASIGDRYLGTFGHLGAWSTNESKHMKSGEGGFVLTDSRKLAERGDLFSDKCYKRFPGAPATPAFPAINVRMSDVNAALALTQLKRVPKWIARRQAFGASFCEGIAGIPGASPHPQPRGANPSCWWTMFVVDREALGIGAKAFCEMVRAEGIPASPCGEPNVLEWALLRKLDKDPNVFRSYRPGRLKKGAYGLDTVPNARTVRDRVVCISMSQHNTVGEARSAARAVRKVAEALADEGKREA